MSTISLNKFFELFKNTVNDIDQNFKINDKLQSQQSYDSIAMIKTALLIEDNFNFQISLEILNDRNNSIKTLYDYCLKNKK